MPLLVLLMVPGSPRWFLTKAKVGKARDIVLKLHKVKRDADLELFVVTVYQTQKQRGRDREMGASWARNPHALERL